MYSKIVGAGCGGEKRKPSNSPTRMSLLTVSTHEKKGKLTRTLLLKSELSNENHEPPTIRSLFRALGPLVAKKNRSLAQYWPSLGLINTCAPLSLFYKWVHFWGRARSMGG